jgi:hypothetical protein
MVLLDYVWAYHMIGIVYHMISLDNSWYVYNELSPRDLFLIYVYY